MQLLKSEITRCEKTHNKAISALLNVDWLRTIHSLPAEKDGFSPDEIARLNAGLILDAQYLKFLSDIALDAAYQFYSQLADKRILFDMGADIETRRKLGLKFVDAASRSANQFVKAILMDSDDSIDEGLLFAQTYFETFKKEGEKLKEADKKGNIRKIVTLGLFGLGKGLVQNKYFHHYNHVVAFNTHADALKDTIPAQQIYVLGHEMGHSVDQFLIDSIDTKMPLPFWLKQGLEKTKQRFKYDNENSAAYTDSVSEQYAEYMGHSVRLYLLNELSSNDMNNSPEDAIRLSNMIKQSLDKLKSIQGRAAWNPKANESLAIVEKHRAAPAPSF